MPSLTGTSPSPSPSASPDGQSDTLEMLCAVLGFIWLMVAAMYTSWSVLTILDKRRDTHTAAADETKVVVVVVRAPRTRITARLIWAVLKGLLWPLVVLWELVDMIVTEWCVCSTCDTTDCWRKCADACEELSREPGEPGDDHVHRGAARQTAQSEGVVVRSPPLAMESMEMLPTYQEATMPAGLSERKGD